MTHVAQVQNFRVGSFNPILNSMGRGVQRGGGVGGGGLVLGLTGKPPPPGHSALVCPTFAPCPTSKIKEIAC